MLTRWGRQLDPGAVLAEYPRPQLVRDSHLSLNGVWDYAITDEPVRPEQFDGPIVVPFSPEAPLSGVCRSPRPDQTLWYRRRVILPSTFLSGAPGERVLLHFGAVDQECRVTLDRVEVGHHVGGFLPFSCDLTAVLDAEGDREEHELVVQVRDVTEAEPHARGKQRTRRGGIWYTPQSGIWQTVWVEAVPAVHVRSLHLVPHLADECVEVTVHASLADQAGTSGAAGASPAAYGPLSSARIEIRDDGRVVAERTARVGAPTLIHLPNPRPWSPEDPHLYDVTVRLGDDRVDSYVGMRSFGVGHDAAGHPRLLLNGEPYLHVGVLDQGYWPDGLLTPPSDEAMVHDIETMKRLGFTMLRKHIKVEPLRWYHHCDRIGMLVWQDLVNGGGSYHPAVVTAPAVSPVRLSDHHYRLFAREDPGGRAEFEREVRATVALLRNVVGLAVWVPFNEGWGQFDATRIAADVARLDPTRQVDHASGWHDQGGGEIRSLHVYLRPFRLPRSRDRRVVALTEYGGYSLPVAGHVWGAGSFGYRRFETVGALARAFTRLHVDEIEPAVRGGLAATVYTQVTDVEDELNGLLTYDRDRLKLPEGVVRAVLARLRSAAPTAVTGRLHPLRR